MSKLNYDHANAIEDMQKWADGYNAGRKKRDRTPEVYLLRELPTIIRELVVEQHERDRSMRVSGGAACAHETRETARDRYARLHPETMANHDLSQEDINDAIGLLAHNATEHTAPYDVRLRRLRVMTWLQSLIAKEPDPASDEWRQE